MNRWILTMLAMGLSSLVLQAQPTQVTQSILPTARVSDPDDVRLLLDLMFIFEEEVSRLDVIDVTANGFGPDDIVVAYPSQQTYFLGANIDRQAQDIMDRWAFEAEFRRDASSQVPPERFDPNATPTAAISGEQAEMDILAEILYALRRNYQAENVRMLFERSDGAFTFQLWDYEPDAMRYIPRPTGPPDTLTTFDLLYILASDSLVEADTAYYDILYLQRTIQDSVFIPVEGRDPVTTILRSSPGSALVRERRRRTGPFEPER